jgi:hypothetical protein
VNEGSIQDVGQSYRELSRQQIDIELQVPSGIEPIHRQSSSVMVGGTPQVKNDRPCSGAIDCVARAKLAPTKRIGRCCAVDGSMNSTGNDLELVRNSRQFPEFEVTEVLNADSKFRCQNGEHKSQGTPARPQQEQAQHGETRGDAVEKNHNLAVSEAMLQKLVVNVLAVSSEHGPSPNKAPDNRQNSFKNRKAKRDIRMATATIVGDFCAP